eukprot:4817787-Alexandrium_andersonii.AAC.1
MVRPTSSPRGLSVRVSTLGRRPGQRALATISTSTCKAWCGCSPVANGRGRGAPLSLVRTRQGCAMTSRAAFVAASQPGRSAAH